MRFTSKLTAGLVFLILALDGLTSWAQAGEFVRPDCRLSVQPSSSLVFESSLQFEWYRRFWTGDCQTLGMACVPGSPNWNAIVSQVLDKSEAAERKDILTRVCHLGQTVGFEWARPKSVRRLDTGDLFNFGQIIRKADHPSDGLSLIELQVRNALRLTSGS